MSKTEGDTSKDNELNLPGDEDIESFTGSHVDLESAADNLFTSPPRHQPLPFESLPLKTPAKSVPPTPGMALQQKIESKLEKSPGFSHQYPITATNGGFSGFHARDNAVCPRRIYVFQKDV